MPLERPSRRGKPSINYNVRRAYRVAAAGASGDDQPQRRARRERAGHGTESDVEMSDDSGAEGVEEGVADQSVEEDVADQGVEEDAEMGAEAPEDNEEADPDYGAEPPQPERPSSSDDSDGAEDPKPAAPENPGESPQKRPRGRPRKKTYFNTLDDAPANDAEEPPRSGRRAADESQGEDFDVRGEEKITPDGVLLGGRRFKFESFKLPRHETRFYCFSLDVSRCLHYRDSAALFQRHPKLRKVNPTYEDRDYLVDKELIAWKNRNRAFGLVTARSVFKMFGHKVIRKGRSIRDDYHVGDEPEPEYPNDYDDDSEEDEDALNGGQNVVDFEARRRAAAAGRQASAGLSAVGGSLGGAPGDLSNYYVQRHDDAADALYRELRLLSDGVEGLPGMTGPAPDLPALCARAAAANAALRRAAAASFSDVHTGVLQVRQSAQPRGSRVLVEVEKGQWTPAPEPDREFPLALLPNQFQGAFAIDVESLCSHSRRPVQLVQPPPVDLAAAGDAVEFPAAALEVLTGELARVDECKLVSHVNAAGARENIDLQRVAASLPDKVCSVAGAGVAEAVRQAHQAARAAQAAAQAAAAGPALPAPRGMAPPQPLPAQQQFLHLQQARAAAGVSGLPGIALPQTAAAAAQLAGGVGMFPVSAGQGDQAPQSRLDARPLDARYNNFCGAPNRDGYPCRRPVTTAGERCLYHKKREAQMLAAAQAASSDDGAFYEGAGKEDGGLLMSEQA